MAEAQLEQAQKSDALLGESVSGQVLENSLTCRKLVCCVGKGIEQPPEHASLVQLRESALSLAHAAALFEG